MLLTRFWEVAELLLPDSPAEREKKMLEQNEVEQVVYDYENGDADLTDLAAAFDNWDGDPFAVL